MGSMTSIRSGESMATRPPAAGNWARIADRWAAVIVQIRSACRTRFSVSGWLSWPDRSQPASAIASMAAALALPPPHAAMPALATTTPRDSTSSGLQPKCPASSCRRSASAIGLRQVLPVQTKSTIRLDSRLSVSSDTMPGCNMRKSDSSTSIVETGWAYRARPSSITSDRPRSADPAVIVAARLIKSAAVTAGGWPGPPGSASTTGPASMRRQSASIG